jgi:hypothetical protein
VDREIKILLKERKAGARVREWCHPGIDIHRFLDRHRPTSAGAENLPVNE